MSCKEGRRDKCITRAFLTFVYYVSVMFEVGLTFLFVEQASGFQQELLQRRNVTNLQFAQRRLQFRKR